MARRFTHLGDGAYAGFDGFQFWLGANHHENMTVALPDFAAVAFAQFVKETAPHVAAAMLEALK